MLLSALPHFALKGSLPSLRILSYFWCVWRSWLWVVDRVMGSCCCVQVCTTRGWRQRKCTQLHAARLSGPATAVGPTGLRGCASLHSQGLLLSSYDRYRLAFGIHKQGRWRHSRSGASRPLPHSKKKEKVLKTTHKIFLLRKNTDKSLKWDHVLGDNNVSTRSHGARAFL